MRAPGGAREEGARACTRVRPPARALAALPAHPLKPPPFARARACALALGIRFPRFLVTRVHHALTPLRFRFLASGRPLGGGGVSVSAACILAGPSSVFSAPGGLFLSHAPGGPRRPPRGRRESRDRPTAAAARRSAAGWPRALETASPGPGGSAPPPAIVGPGTRGSHTRPAWHASTCNGATDLVQLQQVCRIQWLAPLPPVR